MKIIPVIALFASAMSVSAMSAPAGEVWESDDPYRYFSILKAHEETEQMMREKFRQEHSEELSIEGCNPQIISLTNCFESVKEQDGEGCWNCALPDAVPNSCEEYCMGVEQCRSDTCHSGAACISQYYSTLNCVLGTSDTGEECTCDENASGHKVFKKGGLRGVAFSFGN
mmetsp:Transcript_25078/g.54216  ORF Transcript_25078/g.54216 Transcript_25078/m.54216 type:complete len:170 (+) Transcript_25078:125-634(+)